MNGGRIAENRSFAYGGGIALQDSSRLEITAGAVSDNRAEQYGGGIYICDSSSFSLLGGNIRGNVSSWGGGVSLLQGSMYMAYAPVIMDNLNIDGGRSNLCIDGGMTVQFADSLDTLDRIGVTVGVTAAEGVFTNGWSVMGAQKEPGNYFASDRENFIVRKDDATGEAMLESHNEHDYGTEWLSDEDKHWQSCVCGDIVNRDAHTEDEGTVTTEPTETETGVRTYQCVTCERILRAEIIPALTVEAGQIEAEIPPATQGTITKQELAELVLTDEEKQQVQNGTNILIRLVVEDANGSVEETDRTAVEAARGDYQVGQYLDISLLKIVNDADPQIISETKAKLRITIAIADVLKNTADAVTREYAVLRVHNGESSVLEDIDSDADTITIESDRFSTYAIIYKDSQKSGEDNGGDSGSVSGGDSGPVSGGDNGGGSGTDGGNGNNSGSSGEKGNAVNNDDSIAPVQNRDREPKTGDLTPLEIYATLSMVAAFSYLAIYFSSDGRGLKEEEKKKLVSKLIGWARQGGKVRKMLALAAIFLLLLYYHGIVRKMSLESKEA